MKENKRKIEINKQNDRYFVFVIYGEGIKMRSNLDKPVILRLLQKLKMDLEESIRIDNEKRILDESPSLFQSSLEEDPILTHDGKFIRAPSRRQRELAEILAKQFDTNTTKASMKKEK